MRGEDDEVSDVRHDVNERHHRHGDPDGTRQVSTVKEKTMITMP